MSADTEHTYIAGTPGTTQAYIENYGSSIASNQSHDGGSSQVSLLNGNSSNGSQSTIACYGPDDFDGYYCGIPSVLDFNGTRLIFQGEIGRVSSNSRCYAMFIQEICCFKQLLPLNFIAFNVCLRNFRGIREILGNFDFFLGIFKIFSVKSSE